MYQAHREYESMCLLSGIRGRLLSPSMIVWKQNERERERERRERERERREREREERERERREREEREDIIND